MGALVCAAPFALAPTSAQPSLRTQLLLCPGRLCRPPLAPDPGCGSAVGAPIDGTWQRFLFKKRVICFTPKNRALKYSTYGYFFKKLVSFEN